MELWAAACLACLAALCFALCQIVLSIAAGRWKLRHLPGAPTHLFFGSLDIWPRKAIEAGRKWRSEHGDVVKFFLGARPMVMLHDPDHVGQVLKTLSAFPGRFLATNVEGKIPSMLAVEGPLWKFLRNSTAPIFFKSKLARFTSVVEKCAGAMVRQMGVDGGAGKSVEVLEAFRLMTLDIIGTVAFGVEINAIKDDTGEFGRVLRDFLQAARTMVSRGGMPFMVMRALGSMGLQLPPLVVQRLPIAQPLKRCAQLITLTITSIVKSRRKEPAMEDKAKRDFITLMIEARERESGRALNDLEIMYNSRLFLIAGHETTAGTLAIFLYHVTQHPEVQKKILEEVDRLNDGSPLAYESLEKHQYMEMALNESMRMLSVVPMLSRMAKRDFHLGGTVLIPNGTAVIVPVHLLHHDAKLWGDPENFRPERFDPNSDERRQRNPHAFVPFGGGPRVCIGLKFAVMEMLLVLIMLYRQYTFSLDISRTSVPLKYTSSLTIEPMDGIHLHVHKRENGRDVGVKAT